MFQRRGCWNGDEKELYLLLLIHGWDPFLRLRIAASRQRFPPHGGHPQKTHTLHSQNNLYKFPKLRANISPQEPADIVAAKILPSNDALNVCPISPRLRSQTLYQPSFIPERRGGERKGNPDNYCTTADYREDSTILEARKCVTQSEAELDGNQKPTGKAGDDSIGACILSDPCPTRVPRPYGVETRSISDIYSNRAECSPDIPSQRGSACIPQPGPDFWSQGRDAEQGKRAKVPVTQLGSGSIQRAGRLGWHGPRSEEEET